MTNWKLEAGSKKKLENWHKRIFYEQQEFNHIGSRSGGDADLGGGPITPGSAEDGTGVN